VLFTYRQVPVIAQLLGRRGVEATELLDRAGLSRDAMRGEITAPLTRIQAFVDDAARTLDAPLFGLDLAEQVQSGAYGVAEFVVRTSPTVADGLTALSELAPLINPIGEFRFARERDGRGRLGYRVARLCDTLGCHLNEFTIAYVLRQLGAVIGRPLVVDEIFFSHARTAQAAEVGRRLRAAVRFQAAECGFVLCADELAATPRTADAPLFGFLHKQARDQLARLGPGDVVSQVMRVIEMRLPNGALGATEIAAAMAMTVRSLQRYLADAGTSYRDVLLHVRRTRRIELAHGGVAEAQIAYQLGFSDVRAMHRSLDD
jgi:AraC-like DNA-binding protein